MSTMTELLAKIATTPGCTVAPPSGLPTLPDGAMLPADVREFYEHAGGALLHAERVISGSIRILGPLEVKRIDQVIIGQPFEAGPFPWWLAIAEVGIGNYLALDVSPQHAGLCYDAFRETFARPGYANVIAGSFTDLLNRLLAHHDDSTYWLRDDFQPLGEGFALHGFEPK
jgi:hypothetical protein